MLLSDALPFPLRDDGVERADDGLDSFEVFAEGAWQFGGRMVVAQGAAELESAAIRAGKLFDSPVHVASLRGDVLPKDDQDVAEENRKSGDGFGVDLAKLGFVLTVMKEVNAKLLQQAAQAVLDFNTMEIHGDFNAGDGIRAEENLVALTDVQKFDGEDVSAMEEFLRGEELGRRLLELVGPPVDDASQASEVSRFC